MTRHSNSYAVAPSSLTLSFVGSTVSYGASIDPHASAQPGDLAVLWDYRADGGSLEPDAMGAWTSLKQSGNGTERNGRTWMRVIPGGGLGTVTPGGGSAGNWRLKAMPIFRPSRTPSLITPSTWNGQKTSGTPSMQEVAAAALSVPCIVLGCGGSDTRGWLGTGLNELSTPLFTKQIEINGAGEVKGRMAWTIYNGTPLDHEVRMEDNGYDNILHSGYIAFTP